MDRLVVYLESKLVGYLTRRASTGIDFSYSDDWRSAWRSGNAQPISLSLPVTEDTSEMDATAFVAGLLPDSVKHREMISHELGIGDDPSDFAFLSRMGRDCSGALIIFPEGMKFDREGGPDVEWLEPAELADHLRSLPRRPLLVDEEQGLVLSLAGVNDKAAVVVKGGRVGLPLNGYPSTHIIKVDIPGLEDSIKTEHFCLLLAKAVGLRVPVTRIYQVEDQDFMLMSRYDRQQVNGRVQRIHQEDFCQALNVMPGKKYQRYGGPGWAACFDLMKQVSDPVVARSELLKEAILQFLIGNPDAHAKNYSLVYRNGEIGLSPVYDLNNAAAFRAKFKKAKPIMAMFIGEKDNRDEVGLKDWSLFAAECGLPERVVLKTLSQMAQDILRVLPGVIAAAPQCDAISLAVEDIRSRCEAWANASNEPEHISDDGSPGWT